MGWQNGYTQLQFWWLVKAFFGQLCCLVFCVLFFLCCLVFVIAIVSNSLSRVEALGSPPMAMVGGKVEGNVKLESAGPLQPIDRQSFEEESWHPQRQEPHHPPTKCHIGPQPTSHEALQSSAPLLDQAVGSRWG